MEDETGDIEMLSLSQIEWVKQLTDGRYDPICFLGDGVYGWVCLAHSKNGTSVALKILKSGEEEVWPSLVREVDTLENIKGHENCIKILDHGVSYMKGCPLDNFDKQNKPMYFEDGTCQIGWIVMEYVDGRMDIDLWTLPIEDRISLFPSVAFQLLAALNYIHKMGYIHRDLKMDNVLVDCSDFRIVLADFGMSKNAHLPFHTSGACASMYRAPEIRLIAPEGALWEMEHISAYTYNSDCWSLGILLLNFLKYMIIDPEITEDHVKERVEYILGPNAYDLTSSDEREGIGIREFLKDVDLGSNESDFIDLLEKLLTADPKIRPTSSLLLNHPALMKSKKRPRYIKSKMRGILEMETLIQLKKIDFTYDSLIKEFLVDLVDQCRWHSVPAKIVPCAISIFTRYVRLNTWQPKNIHYDFAACAYLTACYWCRQYNSTICISEVCKCKRKKLTDTITKIWASLSGHIYPEDIEPLEALDYFDSKKETYSNVLNDILNKL